LLLPHFDVVADFSILFRSQREPAKRPVRVEISHGGSPAMVLKV